MRACLVRLADLSAALTREVQGEARRTWREMTELEQWVRVMAEKLKIKKEGKA